MPLELVDVDGGLRPLRRADLPVHPAHFEMFRHTFLHFFEFAKLLSARSLCQLVEGLPPGHALHRALGDAALLVQVLAQPLKLVGVAAGHLEATVRHIFLFKKTIILLFVYTRCDGYFFCFVASILQQLFHSLRSSELYFFLLKMNFNLLPVLHSRKVFVALTLLTRIFPVFKGLRSNVPHHLSADIPVM